MGKQGLPIADRPVNPKLLISGKLNKMGYVPIKQMAGAG
jgi:hypothetical protein